MATIDIRSAAELPVWRRPVALLVLMAAAMPLAFSTWSALLNNFVIEVASFTGVEIGWLHTVREVPGFLAIGVIAVIGLSPLLGGLGFILSGVPRARIQPRTYRY